MWLSKKMADLPVEETASGNGVVSIGGKHPAVVTDAESRDVPVVGPGGYLWCPGVKDEVLMLQEHILGVRQPEKLAPGEVCIYSGNASIRLCRDGSIHLQGQVFINGERWVPNDDDLT